MRLILTVRTGPESGREIVIQPGGTARVGRRTPAEFVFPDDPGMSRLHFAVECTGGITRIQDLNSSNGTWVNGRRVSDAVLDDGDEITAGRVTFGVRVEPDQPSAPVPASFAAAVPLATAPVPEASEAASIPSWFPIPVDTTAPVPVAPVESAPPQLAPPAAEGVSPSTAAAPEPSLDERLLRVLREDFQPLYAILDGARSPQIYKLLAEAKQEARQAWEAQNPGAATVPAYQPPAAGILEGGAQYESLYEGWSKAELTLFAPYLVSLPPQSKLLEKLVSNGWGKSWGVYLTCNLGFSELRHHLRHFLMVNMPDGKQVYFRFYDPRVLRVYLPTCTREEIYQFFGPVWRFATEDEKPGDLLEFVRQGAGMKANIWHLAPAAPDSGGAKA
jgi:pSer/pThr/pTyr-binding forkhead associated (FHA) protein